MLALSFGRLLYCRTTRGGLMRHVSRGDSYMRFVRRVPPFVLMLWLLRMVALLVGLGIYIWEAVTTPGH